jgi:hypothetical protein
LPDVFGPEGQESDARTAAGRDGRSLTSGMAGADHQNVVHARPLTHRRFT